MTNNISKFISADKPGRWLDFYDYAQDLLAGGTIPWSNPAEFVAFYGKAHALLASNVVSLPLEPMIDALLADRPDLRDAMAAKSRPAFPLRQLLNDEALRKAIVALLGPLRSSFADAALALIVPSPKRWLQIAYHAAHGDSMDPEDANDGDEIDGAAVYAADFLREFSESGIDILLLNETPGEGYRDAEQLSWYEPVINTARHYRWQIGVVDSQADEGLLINDQLNFIIAPKLEDTPGGQLLGAEFWGGGNAPVLSEGQFYFTSIPHKAEPENVLKRLQVLT
jgi:hypothetical protein